MKTVACCHYCCIWGYRQEARGERSKLKRSLGGFVVFELNQHQLLCAEQALFRRNEVAQMLPRNSHSWHEYFILYGPRMEMSVSLCDPSNSLNRLSAARWLAGFPWNLLCAPSCACVPVRAGVCLCVPARACVYACASEYVCVCACVCL